MAANQGQNSAKGSHQHALIHHGLNNATLISSSQLLSQMPSLAAAAAVAGITAATLIPINNKYELNNSAINTSNSVSSTSSTPSSSTGNSSTSANIQVNSTSTANLQVSDFVILNLRCFFNYFILEYV